MIADRADKVCCRPSKLSPRLLFGKVTCQITTVMENPQDINHVGPVPSTIDHEVPRITHNAKSRSGATTAEAQVVDQHTFSKFGVLLNAGTFGILADIGQSLGHQ